MRSVVARAATGDRRARGGARGRGGRARFRQAGARRVAGRHQPSRRAGGARGWWRRQLLHARERRGRVFVPRGVPAQPGVAARGPVVATGAGAARPGRGRAAARACGGAAAAWSPAQTRELLAAFGIATPPCRSTRLADAQAAARECTIPWRSCSRAPGRMAAPPAITDGRLLARAWGELHAAAGMQGKAATREVVVQRAVTSGAAGACAIALGADAVFGPVIAVGSQRCAASPRRTRALMLAPLNRRLARDLLAAAGIAEPAECAGRAGAARVGDRMRVAVGARAVVRPGRRRQGRRGDPVPARERRPEAQARARLPAHGDPSLSVRARVDASSCATARSS